jgi:hypothetical protein
MKTNAPDYEQDRKEGRAMVDAAQGKPEPGEAADYKKEVDRCQAERDAARRKAPTGGGAA